MINHVSVVSGLMRGRVIFFDFKKCFGFILGEDNNRYYFRAHNVNNYDLNVNGLVCGSFVDFVPVKKNDHLRANHVKIKLCPVSPMYCFTIASISKQYEYGNIIQHGVSENDQGNFFENQGGCGTYGIKSIYSGVKLFVNICSNKISESIEIYNEILNYTNQEKISHEFYKQIESHINKPVFLYLKKYYLNSLEIEKRNKMILCQVLSSEMHTIFINV